jgi:AraC-like DNA-binding protein
VIDRFARLTDQTAVITPIDLTQNSIDESLPDRPNHPFCGDAQETPYCESLWRSHLTELAINPELHSHTCERGRFCALVPIAKGRWCPAACHLVCLESVGIKAFNRYMEILDLLAENFIYREADLIQTLGPRPGRAKQTASSRRKTAGRSDLERSAHSQVQRAIQHVEEHLTDTDLTVASVCRAIGMNPTYLAHVFSSRVGMRMSRYIASRRIELAKRLLKTTTWQIKQVAYECGYANPDWFSHVFHVHTNMKPGEFRRKQRGK